MKIKIVAVGDSDKHFKDCILEYYKRMQYEIDVFDIKPEKGSNISQIIEKETEKVINFLEKDNNYKIVLSIHGRKLDSLKFSDLLQKKLNITFVIGGPFGLDYAKLSKYVDFELSLSDLTFPHGLTKLILFEQIYRAKTIIDNKSYHY